jgi:hypothetical protein
MQLINWLLKAHLLKVLFLKVLLLKVLFSRSSSSTFSCGIALVRSSIKR